MYILCVYLYIHTYVRVLLLFIYSTKVINDNLTTAHIDAFNAI